MRKKIKNDPTFNKIENKTCKDEQNSQQNKQKLRMQLTK